MYMAKQIGHDSPGQAGACSLSLEGATVWLPAPIAESLVAESLRVSGLVPFELHPSTIDLAARDIVMALLRRGQRQ
jgi:hypothetical protein